MRSKYTYCEIKLNYYIGHLFVELCRCRLLPLLRVSCLVCAFCACVFVCACVNVVYLLVINFDNTIQTAIALQHA